MPWRWCFPRISICVSGVGKGSRVKERRDGEASGWLRNLMIMHRFFQARQAIYVPRDKVHTQCSNRACQVSPELIFRFFSTTLFATVQLLNNFCATFVRAVWGPSNSSSADSTGSHAPSRFYFCGKHSTQPWGWRGALRQGGLGAGRAVCCEPGVAIMGRWLAAGLRNRRETARARGKERGGGAGPKGVARRGPKAGPEALVQVRQTATPRLAQLIFGRPRLRRDLFFLLNARTVDFDRHNFWAICVFVGVATFLFLFCNFSILVCVSVLQRHFS